MALHKWQGIAQKSKYVRTEKCLKCNLQRDISDFTTYSNDGCLVEDPPHNGMCYLLSPERLHVYRVDESNKVVEIFENTPYTEEDYRRICAQYKGPWKFGLVAETLLGIACPRSSYD